MRIQPGISVVIPAKVQQRQALLESVLAIKSRLVREVVIVDDGSDEDIESWIYEQIPSPHFRLFVHSNSRNIGPSISRNYGAQIATSEYILFLDADVVVRDDCIETLYQKARKDPKIIVQPFPDSGDADFDVESVNHNSLLTDPYQTISDSGEITYLYSYCFLILRETFFFCRGFSAFFTITHEDIEFGDRLIAQGVKIFCLKNARVKHDHPFSVDDYYHRCVKNGDSFSRLADITGKTKYRKYLDLLRTHIFSAPFEQLDKRYRELRAQNKFDEVVYSEITNHFWLKGINQYYKAPIISVVIPVADQENRIHRTLRSLKRQCFSNFEIHIVHTESIDAEKIEWTGQQPLYRHLQTEGRLARAMNMAKDAANGQFFTWVQCGDFVDKHYLRLLVNEFCLDQSTSISFCGYKFFGLSEEVDGWHKKFADDANGNELIETFKQWNVVGPGFMVRLDSGIRYNEDNWLSEDWDFYLRSALKGRIRFVNEVLYHYCDHAESLSRQVGWRAQDTSLLSKDQQISLDRFQQALNEQTVCAGYVIRNEDYFIRESILSVIDYVNEICIIDTGSSDHTLGIVEAIQREHTEGEKIKLHHRTIYNYNVSRYRNEIADLTRCDWILIVDGDEVWPHDQMDRFVKTLRSDDLYQTESVDVFQKRWSSMIEQQTNFVYVGSLIRAYRRNHRFLWRQSETIDFFLGESRLEDEYCIDLSKQKAREIISQWLSQNNSGIELQSVEYAYRNFDGALSDRKLELDVYFHHFSRCKGELYLRDRVERIHQKLIGTREYIHHDRSYNQQYERFIPLQQHDLVRQGLSIIIPHYCNLDGLCACLTSIEVYPPGVNFEVLVINENDQQHLTMEQLGGKLSIRIINCVKRRGYAAAANLGIRSSRYDHLCLLNDDVQITAKDWGKIVVSQMASDDDIAVAGPLTNRTGGYPPIQHEEFSDAKFEDCRRIAENVKNRPYTDVRDYTVLSGFCYFLKRECVVNLGLLDEDNYPWGYGEENAYTFQLLKNGYRGILVNSVFVWHELSQTFNTEGIHPTLDLNEIKKQNISRVVGLAKPKLVAYGRAKNEALIIEEQLRRMLSFCDEVVIHDTGSEDETVKIAKSFKRVTVLETNDSVTYNAAIQLNMALQVARSRNPDWLLYFDIDQFYDDDILYEIDLLLNDADVDIWSFRLYDGRFCCDEEDQPVNLDFIVHTRRLCEPCYRVLPSLYRNSPDLMIAEPDNWSEWANGNKSKGVSFPAEHCVLPIQYIDKTWTGSFYERRIANTLIRHLGNCITLEDLERKKTFYTSHASHKDYADEWRQYPLSLPRNKLMKWQEKIGTEVDLGSNLVKYLHWDKDKSLRKAFLW